MDKQIYRLSEIQGNGQLEFYVCTTNDVEPYVKLKTIGAVFLRGEVQADFDFDEEDIDNLIKYLSDSKQYIEEYNKKARLAGKE